LLFVCFSNSLCSFVCLFLLFGFPFFVVCFVWVLCCFLVILCLYDSLLELYPACVVFVMFSVLLRFLFCFVVVFVGAFMFCVVDSFAF